MSTTTDLSAERAILHWAAERLASCTASYDEGDHERSHIVGLLRLWANQLSTVPPEPATSSEGERDG